MTEVPKIAHQRLRAAELGAQTAQTHPEADVLAAFAEQSLPAAERESMLAHLSLCANCRDVVLLALPATEVAAIGATQETEAAAAAVVQPTRPNWFADLFTSNFRFANLRWAALAAGVAVALFIVHAGLEQPGKSDQRAGISQKAAATEPAQVASEVKPQSGPDDAQTLAKKAQLPSVGARSTAALQPAPAAKMAPSTATAITASNNADHAAAPIDPSGLPGKKSSGDQVVREQTAADASPPVDITSAPTLLAENNPPSVEKAKPPLSDVANETEIDGSNAADEQATSALLDLKQGMLWRLAAGVLQRSSDGGQDWLPILQGEHPWLCYAARGRELWAGGPAGALQYSVDDGASWNVVAVFAQGQSLSGDVIHIEVLPASQIVVSTTTAESWTSSDGKSWEKK